MAAKKKLELWDYKYIILNFVVFMLFSVFCINLIELAIYDLGGVLFWRNIAIIFAFLVVFWRILEVFESLLDLIAEKRDKNGS